MAQQRADFNTLGDVVATEVGDDVQLDVNWNTWPYPFISNFNLPANSFWIDEGVVWKWTGGDNFEITLARYRNNQSGIVEKTGNSNWERQQTLAPIVEVHDREQGTTYQGRLSEVDVNHDNAGLRIGFYDEDLGQTGYLNIDYQDRIGTGVVVTSVLDGNAVQTTDAGEEPITAEAVRAMGATLVSGNRVADAYDGAADTTILTKAAVAEAVNELSGPGGHITTSGTGNNIVGVDKTGDNVTNLQLGTIEAGGTSIAAYSSSDAPFALR